MRGLLSRYGMVVLLAVLIPAAAISAVTGGAKAAKVGQQAPYVPSGEMQNFTLHQTPQDVAEVTFKDAEGHDLSLADFKGRLVMLNLWATWCAPCRREMPDIDALQAKYGGKDFVVLALSQDRKGVDAVRDFYAEIGVKNLEIFIDQKARSSRKLRATGLPTTLLLNKSGSEIGRLIGPANWNSADAQKLIEYYLRD